jgi:hypothetical protein
VDQVRHPEVKTAPEPKRSRYTWFKDNDQWTRRQILEYADLSRMNLKEHWQGILSTPSISGSPMNSSSIQAAKAKARG